MRSNRLITGVGDFPGNVDNVGVAAEGQDLGDLAAIGGIGLETDLQFVGAIGQFVGAGDAAEGRTVGRQAFADQAALRKVLVRGVEEDKVLVLVALFLVVEQFETDDVTALGGDGRFHQIGTDGEGLGSIRHRCGSRRGRCDRARLQADGGTRCVTACGSGRLSCSGSNFGSRFRLVVLLPVFPQQKAGEREDHHQDQASSVHERPMQSNVCRIRVRDRTHPDARDDNGRCAWRPASHP